jgi:hypothetical protein
MEIIEDWTTIQCPWCHEVIDFVEYYQFGKPELTGIGLTPERILQWEIDLSIESLEPLYNNFLAVNSKLLNQILQIFVLRPEARLRKEDYYHIFIHFPDCLDYFTLNVMNVLNDKIIEQRHPRSRENSTGPDNQG